MTTYPNRIWKWVPAALIMGAIYFLSSRTASQLPIFGSLDYVVKKCGHMLGYALLSASYWHALGRRPPRIYYAWALAVAFATTDEFHQSFVAGRHPSAVDILVFDNLGAAIGLWVGWRLRLRGTWKAATQTPDPAPRPHPKSRDGRSEYR